MPLVRSPLAGLADLVGLDPECETLAVALTHSSYASENGVESNERLEYLGDAVVDLAVADLIVREYPGMDPGAASLVRARVVNESALAGAASRLGLADHLRVGRGEVKTEGPRRPSLLADTFEALVAALYLERGYDAAREFVVAQLGDEVAEAARRPREVDPKARFLHWTMVTGRGRPEYDVRSEGPSHERRFRAEVAVDGVVRGAGEGRSKKAAEAAAAEAAWGARDA